MNGLKDKMIKKYGKNPERIRTILDCLDESDSVLDIGCVQHDLESQTWKQPPDYEWLHADIARKCERVIGMDLLEEDVNKMNKHGYNAIVGDAESFSINNEFDKIVAGELIEHLSNPGMFLKQSVNHLADDGSIIISTPNPVNIENVLWHIRGKEFDKVNSEHTAWFDPVTLSELASRYGLFITSQDTYGTGIFPLSSFILRRFDLGHPLHIGGYVYKLKR